LVGHALAFEAVLEVSVLTPHCVAFKHHTKYRLQAVMPETKLGMRGTAITEMAKHGFNRLGTALIAAALGLQPMAAVEKTKEKAGAAGAEENPADLAEKIRAIFPGVSINSKERFVDVQSVVCLTEGYLEVIACAKDSREHESLVMVEAKPSHIHAALLLIGSKPGNPAMSKPVGKEGTRWIDIPPRGQEVKATLLVPDEKGVIVERPINDFVKMTKDESALPEAARAVNKFPNTFLFAGSHTHQEGEKKTYLADMNGNVISISTFGDEVLCLSGHHGQENHSLSWQIKPESLPVLGTKVTLRLRPIFAANPE